MLLMCYEKEFKQQSKFSYYDPVYSYIMSM